MKHSTRPRKMAGFGSNETVMNEHRIAFLILTWQQCISRHVEKLKSNHLLLNENALYRYIHRNNIKYHLKVFCKKINYKTFHGTNIFNLYSVINCCVNENAKNSLIIDNGYLTIILTFIICVILSSQ